VIPIGQNERFVRAYEAAVSSQKGDALINPEITEHWFWGYIFKWLQHGDSRDGDKIYRSKVTENPPRNALRRANGNRD
jgi:hypothetical protein